MMTKFYPLIFKGRPVSIYVHTKWKSKYLETLTSVYTKEGK